jgi:hypothetical protein
MTTDLALTRPDPTMDEGTLRVMMAVADRYVKSGLLPASIKTPQQALIIMGMGRELGIPATVALRGIVVVNGKPTCSAELMMALVHRTYGQSAIRVYKTDSKACTVQYRQAGWDGISEHTFTIEEAEQAGLFKNPVWKQYPAAMLRARAISAAVRFAFPECISGVYLPEEMGATVDVVDGEVVPIIEDAPPSDVQDGISYCDADHFNKLWHQTVKGTRFEDDDTRHKYIAHFTNGKCDSLTAFLKGATNGEAIDLIESIKKRIAAEARKAREALETEARQVIVDAQAAGGRVDAPDDLAEMTDAEIREMIDPLKDALRQMKPEAVTA